MYRKLLIVGPVALGLLAAACSAGYTGRVTEDADGGLTTDVGATFGTCVPTQSMRLKAWTAGCTGTYAGDARVIGGQLKVGLVTVPVSVSDTGQLPSGGGSLSEGVANVSIGLLTTGVTSAAVTGSNGVAASHAGVVGFGLTLGLVNISADVIGSTTTAVCGSQSATTAITNLKINGSAVTITGAPNQHVVSGAVSLVINEQIAGTNKLHTNALHISALGLADLTIGESEAGLVCSCPAPPADAGSLAVDSGTPTPPVDAGVEIDSGGTPPVVDAGVEVDSGIVPPVVIPPIIEDAGTSTPADAGSPPVIPPVVNPPVVIPPVVIPPVTLPAPDAGASTPADAGSAPAVVPPVAPPAADAGTPPSTPETPSTPEGSGSGSGVGVVGAFGASCDDGANACGAGYTCNLNVH